MINLIELNYNFSMSFNIFGLRNDNIHLGGKHRVLINNYTNRNYHRYFIM